MNVIMRKQFPQSGPRSTEFGERGLCKITFNAGLQISYAFKNWTNRQFMAVGLIDKYLKNAVRMTVAADYSWGGQNPDQDQRYQRTVDETISITIFYCTVKCTSGRPA